MLSDSILVSIKELLNVPEDNHDMDNEIIMNINMALNIATQLGVGPKEGFVIQDESESWSDFTGGDPRLEMIRMFVYLRTRLLFDTSTLTSSVIASLEEKARELEFRLNVQVDPENTFDN